MVHISKNTLADIQVHLQHAYETIEFLQIESQLQRIELQDKRVASKSFPGTTNHLNSFIQLASSVEADPVNFLPNQSSSHGKKSKVNEIDAA